jgi:hypothetical protein
MNTFVSDPDREARANSVKNAIAICRMEGGEPSEYCLEQLALFEAGIFRRPKCATGWSVTRRKDARTDDHSSDSRMIGERAVKPRLPSERMLEEETQHFLRRVRASRIGVGASRTAARPGVAGTMNVPVFRDRPPAPVG